MSQPAAAEIVGLLSQKDAQVLNLLAMCRTKPYEEVWKQGPELLRCFARLLLKQGHPTFALEIAARGLDNNAYPNDHDLMYCRALALVRCGNTTRADWFIHELLDRTDLKPVMRSDALSLAGRIRKDLASQTRDTSIRLSRLRAAFDFYWQAYQLTNDTFPGINAATLALLVGLPELSRDLAAKVRMTALDELEKPGKEKNSWLLATLGEAYLLLGDTTAVHGRYSQAVRLAHEGHGQGDIASMRRQLLLLREHLHIGDELLGLFRLGPVVVFAGHNLDCPGDTTRFPADPALEAAVCRAIRIELDDLECAIGYCMPGCGSDILFGEMMRERDAELHIVLPFAEEDFISDRITYDLEELKPWEDRYRKLCGQLRVPLHHATTEAFLNDQVLYDFGGTFMQGLALARAADVDVEPIALVVQDSTPHKSPGGLDTFIENWKKTGRSVRIIDLARIREQVKPKAVAPPAPLEARPLRTARREVKAMLFADVAGFSNLPEPHLPEFFQRFLEVVRAELEQTQVLFANTWGDGLYIVFEEVVTCGHFAMRLLQRLEEFDWKQLGFVLKEDKKPGVRIGLHTGPVFKGFDAVLKRENYFGSHVSRAARIEPVTAPGSAFVSEQFAAALALAPGHDLLCEYLGLQPLAKDYDVCPLYRLRKQDA